MPRKISQKPLYQRGEFRLSRRDGRSNFEIIWYDAQRKRERSRSTGTRSEPEARRALDALYVETHGGIPCCPTCGKPIDQAGEALAILIANYLETRPPRDAMHARLGHVLDWMESAAQADMAGKAFDETTAATFRAWLGARPYRRADGSDHDRAPGTIENSLIGLAAALRFGGVQPAFKPLPTADVNRTPLFRADIAQIAAMFRYAQTPNKKRGSLLAYLQLAVATWARPDALHDFATAPARRQWLPTPGVIALNPDGRRQTRKYRATLPAPRQIVELLNAHAATATTATAASPFVPVASVKKAWRAMALELGLPVGDGEAGTKLIRRSVAHLARKRLGEEHWIQGEIWLGHHKASTSDVYALPDPANLGRALAATESIIDDIEALAPGAFTAPSPQAKPRLTCIAGGK